MLGYGFAVSANPFDHYSVGFKVPPGSPLEEARKWRATQSSKANKKGKANERYRYYVFNSEHPRAQAAHCLETSIFSQDLFESISILSANIRELQSDRFRATGTILEWDPRGMTDRRQCRNLLHTLCQLRSECANRLELLRVNISRFRNGSKPAMSQKQQYAEIYSNSQLVILETAALLCRYCILRAQTLPKEDSLIISSAAAAERIPNISPAVINIQHLVHRMHSTIGFNTLFSFSVAVDLLPENLALTVRNAAEAVSKALERKAQASFSQPLAVYNQLPEKIKFTILLAALRKAYTNPSDMLPKPFKAWIRNLQSWYPFDDPFWNGPTEDFVPTLEVLMEVADLLVPETFGPIINDVLCDPQMLCWAWNVQEEEGLFSDTEVSESNGNSTICQPSTYLLCIPGLHQSNGSLD